MKEEYKKIWGVFVIFSSNYNAYTKTIYFASTDKMLCEIWVDKYNKILKKAKKYYSDLYHSYKYKSEQFENEDRWEIIFSRYKTLVEINEAICLPVDWR